MNAKDEKVKNFLENCKLCPFRDMCTRLTNIRKLLENPEVKLSEGWLDCNPCVYCGFWDGEREGCECPTHERYLCPFEPEEDFGSAE